jgi:hypothetical protein
MVGSVMLIGAMVATPRANNFARIAGAGVV